MKCHDNKPLISIICPVHNAEETISNMLDSVLLQDYKNLQLIIVDDLSNDYTADIIKKRIEKDARIIFIQNDKNTGPGPAKNKAISVSTGEFITFIDGDDWIEPNAYSLMINKQMQTDADIVVIGYSQDFLDKEGNLKYSVKIFPPDLNGQETTTESFAILDMNKIFSFCWSKLYRASLIKENQIEFPEMMHSEDFFFNMSLLPYINKTVTIDKILYHYIKPCHQTLTTGEYIEGFYELSCNRYEKSKSFCLSQNSFDGNIRSLISNTHLKHLSMCLVYNCSKKSGFTHKQRVDFAKEVLNDSNTIEALNYCSDSSHASKLMNNVFKSKSSTLLVIFGRILWIAKYKLSFIFDKIK